MLLPLVLPRRWRCCDRSGEGDMIDFVAISLAPRPRVKCPDLETRRRRTLPYNLLYRTFTSVQARSIPSLSRHRRHATCDFCARADQLQR
jgi:hypothetical protein